MRKRVIFAASIASLLFVYFIYSVIFDDDRDSQLRQYTKKVADEAYEELADRVGAELERLFGELDENKDGVLQLHEFKDRRLAIAAAMSSARRNFNENLASLPRLALTTRQQVFSFLFTWLQCQLLFLLAIVVVENIKYVIDPKPRMLRLDNDYIDAQPPKVDIKEALRYDTPLTLYERAKMAFFILSGIAALRLFLAVLFLLIGVAFVNIAVAGGRSRATHPRWFAVWESCVNACVNLILMSLGFACIRVYGQVDEDANGAKLLCGNHICAIETLLLFAHGHLPSFVSRAENLAIPGFKAVAQATCSILVNRDAAASRDQTKDAIRERAGSKDGNRLMLFPEGTCNTQHGLFMWKRGAFEPGEPVQLCAFSFPYTHYNVCWSGKAAGGNDPPMLFLRMVCQFVNHAEMRILPTYYPSAEERGNADLYAAHAQRMVAHVARQPISDATFAEYKRLEQEYSRRKHEKKRYTYVDGTTGTSSPTAATASGSFSAETTTTAAAATATAQTR